MGNGWYKIRKSKSLENYFLTLFSIAYVWKHIFWQLLAETKKFCHPPFGGRGGQKGPKMPFLATLKPFCHKSVHGGIFFSFFGIYTPKLGKKSWSELGSIKWPKFVRLCCHFPPNFRTAIVISHCANTDFLF